MSINKPIEKQAADNIRVLVADAVEKANSGHPGMAMGVADYAFTLWYKYMRHNPSNPEWLGRDRFVLSAGHASMLLYSLLYLFDYGLTMDDIKQFRQWGSLTPGHPETGDTKGVEITTGPLASGFASAVGMAMSAKNFSARTEFGELFNDQKIHIIASDGCIMEGASDEAASLAGHLKLDNIVCFYDDNSVTIEGNTSLAFSEDVPKRFAAYGWRVIELENANNLDQIEKALDEATVSDGRPTLIKGTTQIAYGSPNKVGSPSTHGAPLGTDELAETKKALGYSPENKFFIRENVLEACNKRIEELKQEALQWDNKFNKSIENNEEKVKTASELIHKDLPDNLLEELLKATPTEKAEATRASAGAILQKLAELIPAVIGGSADLAPSTKTLLKSESDFSATDRTGRNFHFGVRELAMGFCINGMSLYGTTIPYGSTFLIFSDYMKPAIKLAALQNLNTIFVYTHDSVFVGEDGPTHQPIEQLAMLRATPNLKVIRPANATEAAHAWYNAVKTSGPKALIFSRQKIDPLPEELRDNVSLEKGAYILDEDPDSDIILVASGSEVNLSLEVAKALRKEEKKVRVVSMPSMELFKKQSKEYQEKVIPSTINKKVSIEVATTFGWKDIIGDKGLCIGIDHFGASAPYTELAEKYGFTAPQITKRIKEFFNI